MKKSSLLIIRKIVKKETIIFFIAGLIITTHTWGQEKLRIGFLPFPPFAMINDQAEVTGFAAEKVIGLMKKLDIAHEVQIYPPKRLHLLVSAGNIDFMLCTKTNKSYQEHVNYSHTPYLNLKMMIYSTRDKQIPAKINDLEGTVGMIRGYRIPRMINTDKITLYSVNNHDQLFLMLSSNPRRLDYVIDYETPAKIAISKNKLPITAFKSNVLYKMPLYYCIHKNYPGSQELLRRIKKVNENDYLN